MAYPYRLHTFTRGKYRLWADRVPAMHGMVNSYTLWKQDANGVSWDRVVGGVSMPAIRSAIGGEQ